MDVSCVGSEIEVIVGLMVFVTQEIARKLADMDERSWMPSVRMVLEIK